MQSRALIDKLQLKPHPEGGSYRELYRSSARVQTPRGDRAAITAICYVARLSQHRAHFEGELAPLASLL